MDLKLYDLSAKISEKQYRDFNAINYSLLSKVRRNGPKSLITQEQLTTSYLTFGSLVDTLITKPKDFDDLFYVSSNKIPTKNIKDVIDYLFKNGYEDYNLDAIKEVCLKNDVYQRLSDEVLLKKIEEGGKLYFKVLLKSKNKLVITKTDLEDANNCVNVLKNNSYTKAYMNDPEF